jgi:retinol-binding protein 3
MKMRIGYDALVMVMYERRKMRSTILLVLTAFIPASLLHAQSATLDQATRRAVIERVLKEIAGGYVYSEKAPDIAREIQKHESGGAYDTANDEEFARRLTKDLQSAAHDLHFEIDYSSDALPQEPPPSAGPTREERFDAGKDDNYGFRKIEILKGNVGYIAFDIFHRAEAIGDTLAAAMDFVANTDALILDLRNNDGGRADAVALLVSYFVEGNPQELVGVYWKPLSKTVESFTSPSIKGKKYLDRNVYLLSSKDTVSAAEALCYNMKNLKLATLVGEVTAGAANPGSMKRIDDHFSLFLPTGRAVDPVTGKNWEGTGVNPDVVVSAADSLRKAQILALKAIQEKADANKRQRLEEIVRKLEETN